MRRIEEFFCEPATLEGVQPKPPCQRLEFDADAAWLGLSGGHRELPLAADRRTIARAQPAAKVRSLRWSCS